MLADRNDSELAELTPLRFSLLISNQSLHYQSTSTLGITLNHPHPKVGLPSFVSSTYFFLISKMSARTDTEALEVQASTGITEDTLKATLEKKLDAYVEVDDLSGDFSHI